MIILFAFLVALKNLAQLDLQPPPVSGAVVLQLKGCAVYRLEVRLMKDGTYTVYAVSKSELMQEWPMQHSFLCLEAAIKYAFNVWKRHWWLILNGGSRTLNIPPENLDRISSE